MLLQLNTLFSQTFPTRSTLEQHPEPTLQMEQAQPQSDRAEPSATLGPLQAVRLNELVEQLVQQHLAPVMGQIVTLRAHLDATLAAIEKSSTLTSEAMNQLISFREEYNDQNTESTRKQLTANVEMTKKLLSKVDRIEDMLLDRVEQKQRDTAKLAPEERLVEISMKPSKAVTQKR